MTNRVGVAFIGAGTVAEMHGRGVTAVTNARLVGTYDVDSARSHAITARFGGRVFDSLRTSSPIPKWTRCMCSHLLSATLTMQSPACRLASTFCLKSR